MHLLAEVWEQYSIARYQAKRIIRKSRKTDQSFEMPVLRDVVEDREITDEVDIGVLNIPVKQIVGVVSDREKEYYTADFLPIPSEYSDFAENWTRLYMEHLSDRGLEEPICCYEYLGKFYVIDGKKRVSVLKANGAAMVKAEVIRLLPALSDDVQIRCYYEFIRTFEKTRLYQISFSQPGQSDGFLTAIGYDPEHVWNDSDRYSFIFNWYSFVQAFELAFDDCMNLTVADAVQVLLKSYTYSELKKMHTWHLAELMQDAWEEMNQITGSNFSNSNVVFCEAS